VSRIARLVLVVAVVVGVSWLTTCGSSIKCTGETPVPRLSSVSPTTINSALLPATIAVNGSGFVSWSSVNLDSVPLATNMTDSHHLMATLTWQDLSADNMTSGTVQISVTNAGQIQGGLFGCPNGGSSQLIPITIQ